jgi:hypothetical protein
LGQIDSSPRASRSGRCGERPAYHRFCDTPSISRSRDPRRATPAPRLRRARRASTHGQRVDRRTLPPSGRFIRIGVSALPLMERLRKAARGRARASGACHRAGVWWHASTLRLVSDMGHPVRDEMPRFRQPEGRVTARALSAARGIRHRRFEGALRDGDRCVLGRAVSDNDTGRLKRGLPALRGCHRRAPAPRSRMSASGEMATSDTLEGTR